MLSPTEQLAASAVYVYLMTAADHVKIGIAKDPDWRRRGLQSASPFEVLLVEAVAFPDLKTARGIETELHRLFADFRGYGEWFHGDYVFHKPVGA